MNTHTKAISEALARRATQFAQVFEVIPAAGDSSETLGDGGMEDWASSTDLTNWTEFPDLGSTINQDSTNQRSGAFCCRFDNTSPGVTQIQSFSINWRPGAWFHLNGWCKQTSDGMVDPDLFIRDTTNLKYLKDDGTWDLVADSPAVPTSSKWTRYSRWFQVPTTHDEDDLYSLFLRDNTSNGAGTSTFWDDWSIRGPYDRRGLYYSNRAITFAGDTYTAAALKTGNTRDAMRLVQGRMELTIGNADRDFRQYMEPADLISGGSLRCRLVTLDATILLPVDDDESFVYWQGTLRRAKRGRQGEITLPAVTRTNPRKVPAPGRRFAAWCQVREFADGVDCNYVSSTTAVGAGSDSTALTLAAASNFANGDSILIGPRGAAVAVDILSGGGTTSLVLSAPRSWLSGAIVGFAVCPRERGDCDARQRTHEFQGFEASKRAYRAIVQGDLFLNPPDRPPGEDGIHTEPIRSRLVVIAHEAIRFDTLVADPSGVVPLLVGRRWLRGTIVETGEAVVTDLGGQQTMNIKFIVLGEGEINDIVDSKLGSEAFTHEVVAGEVLWGWYWRPGSIGITGNEDTAAYAATPTVQKRVQNTDHRTITGTTLSRTAYIITLFDDSNDAAQGDDIIWDVEGMLLQKYTAAGAADGSPVFTANPIWAATEVASNKRYALNLDPLLEVDHAVGKVEADFCDFVIASTLALTTTTAAGSSVDLVPVVNSEGFARGMTIDVGAATGKTVKKIVDEKTIQLTAVTSWGNGDTVTGKLPRFESHLYADNQGDALGLLKKIFLSCRGYLTHDHHAGKVQFRVERAHAIDHLLNGNLDAWTTGAPDSWTEGQLGGTINEETTIVKTAGGSSAAFVRTGAGNIRLQQNVTGLDPSQWYLLSLWVRTNITATSALELHVTNTTKSEAWEAKVGTFDPVPQWVSASGPTLTNWTSKLYDLAPIDTWMKVLLAFRTNDTHASTDNYRIRIEQAAAPNITMYVDDIKLEGPLGGYYRDTDDFQPNVEVMNNGDLETWAAGLPSGWTKLETGGTVTEETANVKKTTSAVKIVRSGAGDLWLTQSLRRMLPNRLYELSGWVRIETGVDVPRLRFRRGGSPSMYLKEDGTWTSTVTSFDLRWGERHSPATGLWRFFAMQFLADPTALTESAYDVYLIGSDTNPSTVYYDDVSIKGPIDRVPMTQPGMGVLAGGFSWLNDEEDRRDVNQARVDYVNEGEDGIADTEVENDFAAQRRMGFVKEDSLAGDAVAHADHASRLAKWWLGRNRDLGSGAKLRVGWHGLLNQPGEVIAVRHENPDWDGNLKRIVSRSVGGMGGRSDMVPTLTVEDYNTAIYTDAARGQGTAIARPTLTLTLASDAVLLGPAGGQVSTSPTRGITFTWSYTAGVKIPGIIGYTLFKSTTAAFTPNASNKVADIFSTKTYHYDPKESEAHATLHFKMKARLDRGTVTSNELAILIGRQVAHEHDPGSLADHDPSNLVFDGDFNQAAEWSNNNSTTTADIDPLSDSGDFATGSQGYDNNTTTSATATCTRTWTPSVVTDKTHTFSWATSVAGAKTGFLSVLVAMDDDAGGFHGTLTLSYSVNAGSTFAPMGTYTSSAATGVNQTFITPVLNVADVADLRFKVIGRAAIEFGTNTSHACRVVEVDFKELVTATIIATVGGGRATLKSDGVTAAQVWRAFPGRDPAANPGDQLDTGESVVTRLRAAHNGTAPTADVLVILRSAVDTTLLTIPSGSIGTAIADWADELILSGKIGGNLQIVVSTLSTETVQVDHLGVAATTIIGARYRLSAEEEILGITPSKDDGITGVFTPGDWGAAAKKADVS